MTSGKLSASSRIKNSLEYRINRKVRILFSPFNTRIARINNDAYGATSKSDISEHLHVLNFLVRMKKPAVLVELGTRGGESTRVFTKALSELGGTGYSIDLMPAPEFLNESKLWKHFVGDDVAIGIAVGDDHKWPDGEKFMGIDFLFLDTSHEYDHTVAEIHAWWPLVNQQGFLIFHDTNLTANPTRMLSGGFTKGWNNNRGVARAIEEYFDVKFDSTSLMPLGDSKQIDVSLHLPWCNGLTIIQKV